MYLFDKELVRIRKEKGFSQEYLGKKIDCSRSYICKLESGERVPNRELVLKIADAYNLNRYDLNKLLILAELPTELTDSGESYKICLKLALELKELGLAEEAKNLIENSLKLFENTVEIYALLANLHLMKGDYSGAIRINEDALKLFEKKISPEKEAGITKAELIYNLAYVYFERGVEKKKNAELQIIAELENTPVPNSINREEVIKNNEKIERMVNDCIKDLNEAIQGFEAAYKSEPENENMVEQLSVSYLNMASIESEKEKPVWLKKAIEMYDRFLENRNISEPFKKINASVFLAMAFAKLYDLTAAARLINIVISCRPDYFLGYYAKGCIYSINGRDHNRNLQIAFDNLQRAIEQNSGIKEEIPMDMDLLNLRFSTLFKDKVKELYKYKQNSPIIVQK
jgi:transcriptional regulator with XRE-family HTH domain